MSEWGPWTWWVIAGVLLIAELILPGVFLLWLGLAAAAVGLIDIIVPIDWRAELLLFGSISVGLLVVARPWLKRRYTTESDRPNLNRRMYEYVGKRFRLEEPMKDGRGKLKIEDTIWEIVGPDAPAGTWIVVKKVEGLRLAVEPQADGRDPPSL
jgi:membrane protein implicated in regulation of membrane protease activity